MARSNTDWWICPRCYLRIDRNPVDPDDNFHCPSCGILDPADVALLHFEREHEEIEDHDAGVVYLSRKLA